MINILLPVLGLVFAVIGVVLYYTWKSGGSYVVRDYSLYATGISLGLFVAGILTW